MTIVGRDGTPIRHPRQTLQRAVDRPAAFPALAKKPEAGRQVVPELLRDVGEPLPAVWAHSTPRIAMSSWPAAASPRRRFTGSARRIGE
jgi:hypothetical protein